MAKKVLLDGKVVWIDGSHYKMVLATPKEIAGHHKSIGMSSAGCTCTT